MRHVNRIKDFSTLLHKHGADSEEVVEFMDRYSYLEGFMSDARRLQSVIREKEKLTRAYE